MKSILKKFLMNLNHEIRKRFGIGVSICHYRTSIDFIRKRFEKEELLGAEIGTFKGENAEYILKNLNIKKLYLIDPWVEYGDYLKSESDKKHAVLHDS